MKLLPYALLLSFALPALAAPLATSPDDDPAYTSGTRAMNESRWQDAVTSFDQVVAAKGKKTDGALYWKAYSLTKLGKPQLAAATCTQLNVQFHASPWNRDCAVLTLTLHLTQSSSAPYTYSNTGSPYHFDFNNDFSGMNSNNPHTGDPDDDLRILAINSLANRDPAQAMPILRNILTGNQSTTMKQHAIFVLTQSHSPEAAAMLHEMIAGKQGPALQRQAIQAAGIYHGKRDNDALLEAYRGTSDPAIKRAVISAFFISGDDARMVELARAEKDMTLKRSIVSQLSLMQGKAAQDYMLELLK